MTTVSSPSHELSFCDRVLEVVLLSHEPLFTREITALLYPEVSKVRITNVRRMLHELAEDGRISCIEKPGRERLAWTVPLAASAD